MEQRTQHCSIVYGLF